MGWDSARARRDRVALAAAALTGAAGPIGLAHAPWTGVNLHPAAASAPAVPGVGAGDRGDLVTAGGDVGRAGRGVRRGRGGGLAATRGAAGVVVLAVGEVGGGHAPAAPGGLLDGGRSGVGAVRFENRRRSR